MQLDVVAGEQGGVFTRAQATACGVHARLQRAKIASGEWVAVLPKVFRAADQVLTPLVRAHAGILAAGGGAIVSHTTALALNGIEVDQAIHVTGPDLRRQPGLLVHRAARAEFDVIGGVRVSTREQLLTDLLLLDEDTAVAAYCELFRNGLRPQEVLDAGARARSRWDAARARTLAAELADMPLSGAEFVFQRQARAVCPGWRFNAAVHDGEGRIGYVDALLASAQLVVEIDGWAYHATKFQGDRSRDQRLASIGLRVVRFTYDDVMYRAEWVGQVLTAMVAQAGGR